MNAARRKGILSSHASLGKKTHKKKANLALNGKKEEIRLTGVDLICPAGPLLSHLSPKTIYAGYLHVVFKSGLSYHSGDGLGW